jgi:hypothetical protein
MLSFTGGMHSKKKGHQVILVWSGVMDMHNIIFTSSSIIQTFLMWKVFQRPKIVCKYCDIICALYIYLYWKMVKWDIWWLEVAWNFKRSWFCNKCCFSNRWQPDKIVVALGIETFLHTIDHKGNQGPRGYTVLFRFSKQNCIWWYILSFFFVGCFTCTRPTGTWTPRPWSSRP